MNHPDRRNIAGWLAVAISTAIAGFWAFWGIIENFHEGWYHASLLPNVGLMFAQYLSPMLIFIGLALISVYWPRVGGLLHMAFAIFMIWFFSAFSNAATFLIILPLALFGLLYWYGRPQPRKIAAYLIVGLPLLTLVICGIEPVLRVSQRIDDGNLEARQVDGNGVSLIWAPAGPGWPRQGMDWHETRDACRHLLEDGKTVADEPQNIWRLPTVDEAVRSMMRHGENSHGQWNAQNAQASYRVRPDKESPLWDIHSQVIYWWTETVLDEDADEDVKEDRAYMIVYDGKVWPRSKDFGPAYLGYRCVKDPPTE